MNNNIHRILNIDDERFTKLTLRTGNDICSNFPGECEKCKLVTRPNTDMQTELDFIKWLQQIRNPLFDIFFKGLNCFDTEEFFLILIIAIWFGKNWKVAMKFFAIILIRSIGTLYSKNFFAFPRPFDLVPKLGVIKVSGYGFPSGGATTAILLAGLLLSYGKSRWKWPIALAFFFLISLSRVYLGVHFPRDVLGGWILGGILWALFSLNWSRLENFLERRCPVFLLITSQVVPILIYFSIPDLMFLCAVGMGLALGLFINSHYGLILLPPKKSTEILYRGAIGVLSSFIICGFKIIFSAPPTFYLMGLYLLSGMGVSIGGTWICSSFTYKNTTLQR